VSIVGDPNSSAYNPAGGINPAGFVVSFGHNEFWDNARIESGYFAARMAPRVAWHGGIRFASIGDIQSRQIPSAQPDALFQANDVSFKSGVSVQIRDRVTVGASFGWYLEKIDAWRGSAFNVDLGALAVFGGDVTIGGAVQNIGGSFRLQSAGAIGSRDISLPLTWRLGVSKVYRDYRGAADLVILDDKAHVHLGAEARLHEKFSLRAGYMTGYDSKNFTAGASFVYRNMTFDYAFVPYSNTLGTSHLFNLTFTM
ncbi:MAG: hypothetical protein HY851_06465, partial [candidate division Zixibacteria bacterium]|nr:hypothetical protein [candidate division Zixibacteria bacterium]